MAGDWIKVEHVTPDKPEIYKIASTLNIDPDAVSGKLLRLWIWADQQLLKCNALSVTLSVVDRLTRTPNFGKAMVEAGWLRDQDETILFPNFERHNGNTAKERALSAKRVKRKRDADSVTSPLPEKRREEIDKEIRIHTASNYQMPPQLGSDQCKEAFKEWLEFKLTLQKGKRYTSEKGPQQLLKRWAKFGALAFLDAVEHSISANYQGLIEPKKGGGNGVKKRVADLPELLPLANLGTEQ